MQVLNVVLGGAENDRLLTLLNTLSQDVHQAGLFLCRTNNKEVQLELVTQLRVLVDLDHAIVLHTR